MLQIKRLQHNTLDLNLKDFLDKIQMDAKYDFDEAKMSRLAEKILVGLPIDPIWVTSDNYGTMRLVTNLAEQTNGTLVKK